MFKVQDRFVRCHSNDSALFSTDILRYESPIALASTKTQMVYKMACKIKKRLKRRMTGGGEGGIRTHGGFAPTPDFESGTFDHSATSPEGKLPSWRRKPV